MKRNDLDCFEPDELERLLGTVKPGKTNKKTRDRLMRAVDRRTGLETAGKSRAGLRLGKKAWLALAACFVLLVSLSAGTYAYAEAKEYNEAVIFFEENGLSTEGLSRAEIKAVYRDIKSESFTYSKTNEVLEHSLRTEPVLGYEIESTEKPVSDEPLSNAKDRYWSEIEEYQVASDDRSGTYHAVVYRQLKWTYESEEEMYGNIALPVEGGVAVACSMPDEHGYFTRPALMMLNEDGERLWLTSWGEDRFAGEMNEYEFPDEQVWCMIENDDGSVTAFSVLMKIEKKGPRQVLCTGSAICVTKIAKDGTMIYSKVNPTARVACSEVFRFEDGYLMKMYGQPEDIDGDGETETEQYVAHIDADGNLVQDYHFTEDGKEFKIEDIAESGGKLCVSLTAIDIEASDALFGEIDLGGQISENEFTSDLYMVSAEAFAPHMEEVISARLLIIDVKTGNIINDYEVKGAMGGKVSIEGGADWLVDRIITSNYIPDFRDVDNAYAAEWSYHFDRNGNFLDSEATGNTNYRL